LPHKFTTNGFKLCNLLSSSFTPILKNDIGGSSRAGK
jgi:hypothetical protein